MAKSNRHTGSMFDEFLKEEGIFDEVQARALKRALTEQIAESMQLANLTKPEMANKMATSRSQLDRVARAPAPAQRGAQAPHAIEVAALRARVPSPAPSLCR